MKMSPFCGLMAAVLLGALTVSDAGAWGNRTYMGPNYYGYYGHGPAFFGPDDWHGFPHYNPYMGQFPEYSIMPWPFATQQIIDSWKKGRAGYDTPYSGPSGGPAIPYKKAPPPEPQPDPKAEARRATIIVNVPTEDTILYFDGKKTTKTGKTRTFRTPSLPMEDVKHSYTVKAIWIEAGKEKNEEQIVEFVAGDKQELTFPKKTK